ncbi:MAG: adenylate kinase [Pseudomonadota bacterium]
MRIAVLGNAGSGKSTLSVAISQQYALPLHEVDRFMWGEGWAMTPVAEYEAVHDPIIATDHWLMDGMGHRESLVRRLDRATHVILCDFPLWQNFWLVAERQKAWAAGTLTLRPGDQDTPPPTKPLFETIWKIEKNWMPDIRSIVDAVEGQKPVHRIMSFEALQDFAFTP